MSPVLKRAPATEQALPRLERSIRDVEHDALREAKAALSQCFSLLASRALRGVTSKIPAATKKNLGACIVEVRAAVLGNPDASPRATVAVAKLGAAAERYGLALEKLDELLFPSIEKLAHKIAGRTRLDLKDDLIQEGRTALPEVVERFDLSRGLRLSTYAMSWVRQRMLLYLDEHARTVRLPKYLVQAERQVSKELARAPLDENGMPRSVAAAAEAIGVKPEHAKYLGRGTASLDRELSEDGESSKALIPAEGEAVGAELSSHETRELVTTALREAFATLDERSRSMFIAYHAIDGRPVHPTLEDIGREHELTRERVRQILAATSEKLRTRVAAALDRSADEVAADIPDIASGFNWRRVFGDN